MTGGILIDNGCGDRTSPRLLSTVILRLCLHSESTWDLFYVCLVESKMVSLHCGARCACARQYPADQTTEGSGNDIGLVPE